MISYNVAISNINISEEDTKEKPGTITSYSLTGDNQHPALTQ
jgi:hypothetical protein